MMVNVTGSSTVGKKHGTKKTEENHGPSLAVTVGDGVFLSSKHGRHQFSKGGHQLQ
jgi:hypothetical protein